MAQCAARNRRIVRGKYTDLNPSNFSEFIICELRLPLIGSCFSCRSAPPPLSTTGQTRTPAAAARLWSSVPSLNQRGIGMVEAQWRGKPLARQKGTVRALLSGGSLASGGEPAQQEFL